MRRKQLIAAAILVVAILVLVNNAVMYAVGKPAPAAAWTGHFIDAMSYLALAWLYFDEVRTNG